MDKKFVDVGVLTLKGKRLCGYATKSVELKKKRDLRDTQDGTFFYTHVEMDVINLLSQRVNMFCYYEDGKIKNQSKIYGELDKKEVVAEGEEYITYTLETDEKTDIFVTMNIGNNSQTTSVTRHPKDGIITLEIDPKTIGELRICSISDTKYSEDVIAKVI